jgi:cytochrome c oxidase subunit 3
MTPEVLERPTAGGGLPPAPVGEGGGGGDARPSSRRAAHFGLWLLLATLSMMFIGFTSAYMVRRAAADWRALPVPSVLVWNTAALLASSACLEIARRALGAWDLPGAQRFLAATGVLGALFAGGQTYAWRQLAEAGVFLSSNPHSSFFYLLTGVHLVHLAAASPGSWPRSCAWAGWRTPPARTGWACSRSTGTSWARFGPTCWCCSMSFEILRRGRF